MKYEHGRSVATLTGRGRVTGFLGTIPPDEQRRHAAAFVVDHRRDAPGPIEFVLVKGRGWWRGCRIAELEQAARRS